MPRLRFLEKQERSGGKRGQAGDRSKGGPTKRTPNGNRPTSPRKEKKGDEEEKEETDVFEAPSLNGIPPDPRLGTQPHSPGVYRPLQKNRLAPRQIPMGLREIAGLDSNR